MVKTGSRNITKFFVVLSAMHLKQETTLHIQTSCSRCSHFIFNLVFFPTSQDAQTLHTLYISFAEIFERNHVPSAAYVWLDRNRSYRSSSPAHDKRRFRKIL